MEHPTTPLTVSPQSARQTPGDRQHWRVRFRAWRLQRPFWGGLLTLLSAAVLYGATAAPMGLIVLQGVTVLGTIVLSVTLLVLGLATWFQPLLRTITGPLVVLLAIISLLVSNFGGFGIGMFLALAGGGLIFAWSPDRGGQAEEEPERDYADEESYQDANQEAHEDAYGASHQEPYRDSSEESYSEADEEPADDGRSTARHSAVEPPAARRAAVEPPRNRRTADRPAPADPPPAEEPTPSPLAFLDRDPEPTEPEAAEPEAAEPRAAGSEFPGLAAEHGITATHSSPVDTGHIDAEPDTEAFTVPQPRDEPRPEPRDEPRQESRPEPRQESRNESPRGPGNAPRNEPGHHRRSPTLLWLGLVSLGLTFGLIVAGAGVTAVPASAAEPAEDICLIPFLCPSPTPSPTPPAPSPSPSGGIDLFPWLKPTPTPTPSAPQAPAQPGQPTPAASCDPSEYPAQGTTGANAAKAASVLSACAKAGTPNAAPGPAGAPTVSLKPGTMKASKLTLDDLKYEGIATLNTAQGGLKVMEFSASKLTIVDMDLAIPFDTTNIGLIGANGDAVISGHVRLYALDLSGDALGLLPLKFTPNPPPLLPPIAIPSLFFTKVTSNIALVTADNIKTGISISIS